MLKELFNVAISILESQSEKRNGTKEDIIKLVNEIEKLKVERAESYARATMFNATDKNHFMMTDVNRLDETIKAKQETLKVLKEL